MRSKDSITRPASEGPRSVTRISRAPPTTKRCVARWNRCSSMRNHPLTFSKLKAWNLPRAGLGERYSPWNADRRSPDRRILASGCMSEVYKALDARLERPVAIKFLARSIGYGSCGTLSLPSRSPRRFGLESSQDLHHPRHRRLPGAAVPDAGVAGRRVAEGQDCRQACADGGSVGSRHANRRRSPGGARKGHRAPRHQAGKHFVTTGKQIKNPRLRTRQTWRGRNDSRCHAVSQRLKTLRAPGKE